MSPPTCKSCGTPVKARKNKTGMCRPCALRRLNHDPEIRAKAQAAILITNAKPEVMAKRAASISAARRRKLVTDPTFAEKEREKGRRLAATRLGHLAQPKGSEPRRRAAVTISNTKLAWCPVQYRRHYLFLLHNRRMRATQAKKHILGLAKQDELRKLAVLHASSAADFLRRFTSVMRRDDGWQYGTVLLTPEQLIERAQQKGWEPFELRRAA